jgi:hypothetical protein
MLLSTMCDGAGRNNPCTHRCVKSGSHAHGTQLSPFLLRSAVSSTRCGMAWRGCASCVLHSRRQLPSTMLLWRSCRLRLLSGKPGRRLGQ